MKLCNFDVQPGHGGAQRLPDIRLGVIDHETV
jgi:hypothetical protein